MNRADLVVVQCRFASTRLPGKALFPVGGIPMLPFLLRRLGAGLDRERFRIVLATTKQPSDDIVEAWGKSEGVAVVRGETDDLLDRFMMCLDLFPARSVVRVTADNPLTCPSVITAHVDDLKEKGVDYVQYLNLPPGTGVDVFAPNVLRRLHEAAGGPGEREHLNLHILNNPEAFRIYRPEISGRLARPDIRLTIDTREEWRRVDALFSHGEKAPWEVTVHEVIERMDS